MEETLALALQASGAGHFRHGPTHPPQLIHGDLGLGHTDARKYL